SITMKKLHQFRLINTLCAMVFFISFSAANAAEKLEYTLSMSEPHTHYFEVEMKINSLRQKYTDLKMATWAPGSYLIREFGKSVEDFAPVSKSGKSLKFEKINKNTWRVFNNREDFTASYKVYAFEISVRTSFLDASHGYLNGSNIFMYVDKQKGLSSTLTVKPFKDWDVVSTGLSPVSGKKWTYHSPNFDILADSPIEIGNQEEFEFNAAGVKHKVAMYGQSNADFSKLKEDMAKVVEVATEVFGENPNKEYTFIVHNLTRGSGGLEHLNSTTLDVNRWSYEGSRYTGFLSLVAHEYFHLWNVKRIRPIALGPFDYDKENYTHLLWVMEGFTSYYDELLLTRAGIEDQQFYLNKLEGTINSVENQPGNKVQPVAEASWDAWIKAYRPNENSYNTTISYYPKGALIGSMLDLEIIHNTNGQKSLDDVMRYLYKEYYKKKGRGITDEEMQSAVEMVAGKKLDKFFKNHIFGTKTIDYNKFLSYAGLELKVEPSSKEIANLGVYTKNDDGRLVIRSVVRGTSAYEGGLNANDEIIAIDGYRVDKSEMERIIGMKKPGESVKITITRDGILQDLDVKLKNSNRNKYSINPVENPTEKQQMVYNRWLKTSKG
ncbi:M61 family metallopeptidase, partial [Xanthovirga aplysinae]|uniref:M61 family metallopeptidase n=1 Tax=Xanthovirga aplysinae TaxID=2529853 RepID=UPI0031B5A400